MLKRIILFRSYFLFFLLYPALSFGDGGVLSLQTVSPEEKISPWAAQTFGARSSQRAEIRLADGVKEDVYQVSLDSLLPNHLFISSSQPCRLFNDLNGDKIYQPNEIYSSQQMPGSANGYIFNNVKLRMQLDELQFVIDTRILVYVDKKYAMLNSIDSQRFFMGDITVGSVKYPARLLIQYPFHDDMHPESNFFIVLDSNRDGIYDPFRDICVSPQGFAYINDTLWNIKCQFTASEIKVYLAPYKGPKGKLLLQQKTVQGLWLKNWSHNCILYLPFREDATYTLPAEEYRIQKLWISAAKYSKLFYELLNPFYMDDTHQEKNITIKDSQTETVSVGDYIKQGLEVSTSFLSFISLRFEETKDNSENRYLLIDEIDLGRVSPATLPLWQIRNSDNKVITSGHFEYG